jgi:hypothetical protein
MEASSKRIRGPVEFTSLPRPTIAVLARPARRPRPAKGSGSIFIVVSEHPLATLEPRAVTVKGISYPVEVVSVDWR